MVDDLINGTTIELLGQTASTATLQVSADTTVIEGRIRDLVDVYNTVRSVFKTLRDPDAEDELAGALSGDNIFRMIENRVRNLVTGLSSTPGESLAYLSDAGVSITREGVLEINETKLASALSSNYADLVTMFAADTEKQTNLGEADRGVAGDAIHTLTELMSSRGSVKSRISLAEGRMADYETISQR